MFSIVAPKSTHKSTLWKKNILILGVVPIVESNPRLKNVVNASSIYTIQTGSPNHTTHVVISKTGLTRIASTMTKTGFKTVFCKKQFDQDNLY